MACRMFDTSGWQEASTIPSATLTSGVACHSATLSEGVRTSDITLGWPGFGATISTVVQ